MNKNRTIRKLFFIAFWLLAGSGMIFLLVSAMKSRSEKTCRGLEIKIISGDGPVFVDRKLIEDQITQHGQLVLKGRKLASFHLRQMEALLKNAGWVQKADLYFDNNQVLRVLIRQKTPIARVFSDNGSSFFVDSAAEQLPLAGDSPVKLPVFTGFPSRASTAYNRVLLTNIRTLGGYIESHPFWMSAIAQVDITGKGQFEMIPTLGHHIIEFGDATDCDKKFDRLNLFYRQVLSRVGFEKYERIKVEFDRQVVAVRRSQWAIRADSLAAIRKIRQLTNSSDLEDPGALGAGTSHPEHISAAANGYRQIAIASQQNSPLKDQPPYESKANPNSAWRTKKQ